MSNEALPQTVEHVGNGSLRSGLRQGLVRKRSPREHVTLELEAIDQLYLNA